jgi:hypothetical protein
MNISKQTKRTLLVAASIIGGVVIMNVTGCQSSSSESAASTQPLLGFIPPAPDQSGAQLWSDNCARCHNLRPPGEFSPRQWGVIVQHMRMRANLTGQEARKITEFLQASS